MIDSRELQFPLKLVMLGASSIANEKIKKLKVEVHDLKLLMGELMNSKNTMMREYNEKRQHVYKLEVELNELKSHFASLGEQYQLAESARRQKSVS